MKTRVIPHSGMPEGRTAGRLGRKYSLIRIRIAPCILAIILVLLAAAPLAAQADAPMDVIRTNVEKVFGVLRDPALQDETGAEKKKEAIRNISDDMFNWPLLSKRVLAKQWDSFSKEQQQEFVSLFKVILEQAYINQIMAFKDNTIDYVSSQMLSEKQAEVQTLASAASGPVAIKYTLALFNGKWGVYNVVVEKTFNLAGHYRKEFKENFFDLDKTPEQLLEFLREKIAEE